MPLIECADGCQQGLSQRSLLSLTQAPGDSPPEDQRFGAAGGRGKGQFALNRLPSLGYTPIIDSQSISGPQTIAQKVQPPGLVLGRFAATRLEFHQHLPDPAQERGGPLVSLTAGCFGESLHERTGIIVAARRERAVECLPTGCGD